MDEQRPIYQVVELNRAIKQCLEGAFGLVWVEGEVSNVRTPQSGHCYFTLKDAQAQIRAIFFRGAQAAAGVPIRHGEKIRVHGQLTVYEKGGDYQLIVRKVELAGAGSLQQQFEALKNKLKAEGLFDRSRKKPLPLLPQHVGIVTSATGAAIQDMLQVITRRFPNIHLLITPVKVQGAGAALQISKAIRWLNQRGGIDVIITGRGGGSLEDLWCFNEEVVARAIAESEIPVISGVGHETDYTISDWVADVRAPTPSAAAEVLVGCREAFDVQLEQLQQRIFNMLSRRLLEMKNRWVRVQHSYVFREPQHRVQTAMQQVDQLQLRSERALMAAVRNRRDRLNRLQAHAVFHEPSAMLQQARHRLDTAREHMEQALRRCCESRTFRLERLQHQLAHQLQVQLEETRHRLQQQALQLNALSPFAVLTRGYSITSDQNGHVVKTVAGIKQGQPLVTRLSDGVVTSTVTGINRHADGA